jgi:fibronectin-binding autotransporter adhesin
VDIGSATREITLVNGDLNFDGVISGSGGLTFAQTGGGNIRLRGTQANTYAGLTTVESGALSILKSDGVTAIAGNLLINAGAGINLASSEQIADTATVTVNGSLRLNDASETFSVLMGSGSIYGNNFGGNQTLSVGSGNFSGTIRDTSPSNTALIKTSGGTLTLSGNNFYTGGTTVAGGTLQIGDGGTTGSIFGDVTNDANLTFNRSDDLTFGGVISGAGSLTKQGTGTLTLSGNNTYSGGTTVSAGGLANSAVTVQAGGAFSPGGAGAVESIAVEGLSLDGGNLLFDIGTGGTDFISVADGLGALNAPTQFVFTDNGLVNGTYALLDGLTPGWNLGLLSFAGIAPFGGNFLLSGDGTQLFFSAFDGGVISGPVLQNSTPVGTPAIADFLVQGFVTTGTPTQNNVINSLTFDPNSSLQVFNNLTVTSGNFNVPSGEGTIMGGNVITPGNFNKNGAGTLNINSSFGVGGAANVNAGALMVNGTFAVANGLRVMQNALLGGVGIIRGNVINNGTVAPGNSPGTLTINGTYTQTSSGTLEIEAASPGNFDRLVVSGAANLAGTLRFLPTGGFRPAYGQQFAFLQAASISGGFDSIVVPKKFRGRFINEDTVGILLLAPDTYTRVATNPNQGNVARALDAFIPAVDNDREVVSTALDYLTEDQYPAAFDQIMPAFHETVANIGINLAQNQGQLMQQQLSAVRLGGRGFRTSGIPTEPLVYDKGGKAVADPKDAKSPISMESHTDPRWSVWTQGNGIFSRTTSPSDVPTYRSESGGFLAGADYQWSGSFVTGAFAGYQGLTSRFNNGANITMNGVRFGGYATYDPVDSGFYADAILWGGVSNYKTRRNVEFSTIDRTARASQDSGEFSTLLGGGYDFQVGNFTIGPAASLQYTYFGVAPFTESGAESHNLRVDQQNANSLQSYIGGRVAYTWNVTDTITLIPEGRMFWQHEFLQNPRTIGASLDGGSGPNFDYTTSTPDRDAVFAGAGLIGQFGKNLNAYIYYNADFGRQDFVSHTISTGLNFKF